ncbi:MAG: RluA family pseudouridine synthase [Bacteroidetes bacterium]|nr:MAG: RluA family pseudouridine synthase [Bacteroidota bacterium]
MNSQTGHFHHFQHEIRDIPRPERFNYPFYYEVHPLSKLAAKELQEYLSGQCEIDHNFGLEKDDSGMIIGKMFGVLVVENQLGEIGYLAAFSGKLGGSYHHAHFVPPIYDLLSEASFFPNEEKLINELNHQIERLENDPRWSEFDLEQGKIEQEFAQQISRLKDQIKAEKQERNQKRIQFKAELVGSELEFALHDLNEQSKREQIALKKTRAHWNQELEKIHELRQRLRKQLSELKEERKLRSAKLQQRLFDQYHFLNSKGEQKDVLSIFEDFKQQSPPAGSGECAAPKLLQYAFEHGFKPLSLAEFWWGQSPKSEIRKHAEFYPSCRGKCEPILSFMLQGIDVDPNPLLTQFTPLDLPIIYEDEHLLLVNKAPEFLSVPGKNIQDSVLSRMRKKYPEATGPLLVHRLDMSTSGILLVAKSNEIHKQLQKQFIKRTVEKRYVALIEGTLHQESGSIDLPLRVDLDDRPRQLVCYEHGKSALTDWRKLDESNGLTRVHFFPRSGRTHQLRVHAAHELGLGAPIKGDDLYGKKADRLYLHAEQISFFHPVSREWVSFVCPADF